MLKSNKTIPTTPKKARAFEQRFMRPDELAERWGLSLSAVYQGKADVSLLRKIYFGKSLRCIFNVDGFSKKIENHMHAIAIHYMHYNFVRIHKSLRCTPAMVAGVTQKPWEIDMGDRGYCEASGSAI